MTVLSVATAGDDKRVGIWDAHTGEHRHWLQPEDGAPAHNGTVTSVQFAPDGRLISTGRDNTVKVWSLADGGKLIASYPGRTGEVGSLGISPDGRRLLFDMGEELRILDREAGTRVGSLLNQKQGRFQSFAHFSPSGRFIVTAASNSRLQLWRAPASAEETQFFRQGYMHGFHRGSLSPFGALGMHPSIENLIGLAVSSCSPHAPKLWQLAGHEIRHFVTPGSNITHCGVFTPDESVLFTGGTDKTIRVWSVPSALQWSQPLEARITHVGSQVERGTDMVRIRAEIDNPTDPEHRLRAGLFAVMRVYPETKEIK
jgi:WD40 repeat protein